MNIEQFDRVRVFNEVLPQTQACKQKEPHDFEPTPEAPLLIGTHSGTFHCDEVVATMLLSMLYSTDSVLLVRTRNNDFLQKCHIVVDVGAVYDANRHCYDHHQRGFDEVFSEKYNKVKLSSAGLVWKHFGKRILKQVFNVQDDQLLVRFHDKLYERFFEHIDGIDNGIEVADGSLNYKITTSLSSRVGSCNPSWRDKQPDHAQHFKHALKVVYEEFFTKTEKYVVDFVYCKQLMEKAMQKRFDVHQSGEILVLDEFFPWSEQLFEFEANNNAQGQIKYVLYQESNSSKWRIQAVPVELGSFTSRKALPEKWRGLRGDDLDKAIGLNGTVFVHAAGFIGGHTTFDGVLSMAKMALDQ